MLFAYNLQQFMVRQWTSLRLAIVRMYLQSFFVANILILCRNKMRVHTLVDPFWENYTMTLKIG